MTRISTTLSTLSKETSSRLVFDETNEHLPADAEANAVAEAAVDVVFVLIVFAALR